MIASVVGLAADGEPLVLVTGDTGGSTKARSLVPITKEDCGADVVVMFDHGEPSRPVVLGRLARPPKTPAETPQDASVTVDGARVEIAAEREITLTCGKASITLTPSGSIVLRGSYILSRSTGPNRIKGGSIQLN
jgi:hypothetical protein